MKDGDIEVECEKINNEWVDFWWINCINKPNMNVLAFQLENNV